MFSLRITVKFFFYNFTSYNYKINFVVCVEIISTFHVCIFLRVVPTYQKSNKK